MSQLKSRNQVEGVYVYYNGGHHRSGKWGKRKTLKSIISVGGSRSRKWIKHWKIKHTNDMNPGVCVVCGAPTRPIGRFVTAEIEGIKSRFIDYRRICTVKNHPHEELL